MNKEIIIIVVAIIAIRDKEFYILSAVGTDKINLPALQENII